MFFLLLFDLNFETCEFTVTNAHVLQDRTSPKIAYSATRSPTSYTATIIHLNNYAQGTVATVEEDVVTALRGFEEHRNAFSRESILQRLRSEHLP